MRASQAQLEIKDSIHPTLLITAPAGCGKTEALVLRAEGILERREIGKNQRILVISFSNRAKENIQARLLRRFSSGFVHKHFTITNFHGLSARVIMSHPNILGINRELKLPTTDWVKSELTRRGLSWQQKAIVAEQLRELKSQPLTDEQIEESLVDSGFTTALEVELARRNEQQLTYDDLLRHCEIALGNTLVRSIYRNHFGAVLVDEVQDLTPQQLRLIKLIGGETITYAGDLAQGIYSFTGADPARTIQDIKHNGAHEIVLNESYRSAPRVLELVNSLTSLTNGVQVSSASDTLWSVSGAAAVGVSETDVEEASYIANKVSELYSRFPKTRIGVIARTNRRVGLVRKQLEMHDVQFFNWEDGIHDHSTVTRLKSALSRFQTTEFESAISQLAYLGELTEIESIIDSEEKKFLEEGIEWCLDLLSNGNEPSEISQRLKVGNEVDLANGPGIHLLNGHIGKGQQFDWVFIVGFEEGTIPDFRAKAAEARSEEARILSVMISRARIGVYFSLAKRVTTNYGLRDVEISSFYSSFNQSGMLSPNQFDDWINQNYSELAYEFS